MKKTLCLCLASLSISSYAAANRPGGYEQGNGGFLISCSERSAFGKGVFSVDRIEGQLLYSFTPASSLTHMKNEMDIIHYVLDKLAVINPHRAGLYQNWLQEMVSAQEFVENASFTPLPDSSTTVIPNECRQEQAAIFITEPSSKKLRFLFNKKLWSQAAPLDRAYLLMHELIYREAVLPENRHKNSVAARYFNGWLMAHADQLPERQEDIVDLLQELRFKRTDYNGIGLNLNSRQRPLDGLTDLMLAPILRFKNSQKIKKAPLADSFSIRIGDEIFHRVCNDSFTAKGFGSFVEFYPSGRVKRMHFSHIDGYVPIYNTPGYSTTNCNFHGANYLEFDELGNLTKAEQFELPPNENYDDE